MKTRPFIPVVSLFFLLTSLALQASVPHSIRMVEAHGLGDFYCNKKYMSQLNQSSWDYVSGLVANAVLKAWEQYPERQDFYAAAKAFADNSLNEDGTKIYKEGLKEGLGASNIDDLAAGKVFFTLYQVESAKGNAKDAEKYRTAATLIRNTLKFNHSRIKEGLPGAGGFYHKASYPNQMWLDGLYMGPAVYAQWQDAFGMDDPADNTDSWSDIAHQFKTLHQYTYDAEKQLNYHAWTATPTDANAFWSNQSAPFLGCSKEFWGRGMGWYFAALVDVLEYMPTEHPDRMALVANLQQVAAGLKRWQDPVSGCWFQLLQYDATVRADGKGDTFDGKTFYNVGTKSNYLESSSSSMFTYAYLKGMRLGLLDTATYKATALKAYQGINETFVKEGSEKVNIIQSCASAGLGPAKDLSRTGTINYYLCGKDVQWAQNEGKAIGPYIMAALEYEKMMATDSVPSSVCESTTIVDRYCYDAPNSSIYVFRSERIATLSIKQACDAGLNWLEFPVARFTDHTDLYVYNMSGRLLSRVRKVF
ncbi:MAG: glycoside hydrolase family 88 protein [Bacteroidales bacterium]|nr:glycoside hydrolase family 88 protein [Bacteroidales bacterium]